MLNPFVEIVIYCVTSKKCTNGYCDLSVKNVKKNLKESRILRDINAPAAFAIDVTSNSRPPRRKKSHVCEPVMKKVRIVSEEHAVPVQCPRVQSPTELPPKSQPNEAESSNLQTNVAEQTAQLHSAVQPIPIPSGAPTSVLTCPPMTPAS